MSLESLEEYVAQPMDEYFWPCVCEELDELEDPEEIDAAADLILDKAKAFSPWDCTPEEEWQEVWLEGEDNPRMAVVRCCDLSRGQVEEYGLSFLLSCASLRSVEILDLRENDLGDEELAEISQAPHLAALHTLFLQHNAFSEEGLEAFLESSFGQQVRRVYVAGNEVSTASVRAWNQKYPNKVVFRERGSEGFLGIEEGSATGVGRAGWCGGWPRGIEPCEWPRSPVSGRPMQHLMTLNVPRGYRAQGFEYGVMALFSSGCDMRGVGAVEGVKEVLLDGRELGEQEKGDPFWEGLRESYLKQHPRAVWYEGGLGDRYVAIWLTEEEATQEPCAYPCHAYPDPEVFDEYDEIRMQEEQGPLAVYPLEFVEEASTFFGDPCEMEPANDQNEESFELFQGSECMLQIESGFAGSNFGDGNCQIDLERPLLYWSCL